jgi:hypothetical protein
MRGVKIHATLLAVMVLLALQTWTRDQPQPIREARVQVWERDTTEITSVRYQSRSRELEISLRGEGGDPFFWGVEILPAARPGAQADTAAFPIGVRGVQVVNGFADFEVVGVVGQVSPDRDQEFGLDEPTARLTLGFDDGPRVFEIGGAVYESSDYYARDTSTGDVYVLPEDLIGPLQTGEGAVRERRVHYFLDSEIGRVRLEARGQERVVTRAAGGQGGAASWVPQDTPGQADQTFANFMDRLGQLAIERFDRTVPADRLERLLRLDYVSTEGEPLGFVELYSDPLAASETYYLLSERTRVPAVAIPLLAQRVVQDLEQVF